MVGGIIPADGAVVSIKENKTLTTLFYSNKNQFRYLRTNTYYGNNWNRYNNLLRLG